MLSGISTPAGRARFATAATISHEFTSPSISGESYGASFRSRTRLPSIALRLALRLFNRGIDLLEARPTWVPGLRGHPGPFLDDLRARVTGRRGAHRAVGDRAERAGLRRSRTPQSGRGDGAVGCGHQ
ncbi:MAG: hypothetical protein R2705_23800 [Ilumatobacteraceae bacterium]